MEEKLNETEKELLKNSPLNEEDKKMWEEVLEKMPLSDRDEIFSLLKEDSNYWFFLNENLKSKREAIKNNDEDWFSWIVSKEQEFLEQIK